MFEHIKTVSAFAYNVRHYFNATDPNPLYEKKEKTANTESNDSYYPYEGLELSLIDYAMMKLSNLDTHYSLEGILALVTFLPTDFPQFDQYLNKWFELWASIDHNHLWDFCWLIIISRAAKSPSQSSGFAWKEVLPFLLSKVNNVISVPNVSGIQDVTGKAFPKTFPSFYHMLLQHFKDLSLKHIRKFTKIFYHALLANDKLVDADNTPITLPAIVMESLDRNSLKLPGLNLDLTNPANKFQVKSSIIQLTQFFQSIRPLFHPSNNAAVAQYIGRFVEALVDCISKQFGEAIANKLMSSNNNTTIDEATWNSVRYLQGLCLSICFEGMYSKNTSTPKIYMGIMNQLITLNADFAHVILPYIVDGLEVKQFSQPMKTFATLTSLTYFVHSTLYPKPILLGYLVDLLRLSLEQGIEASDPNKTIVTLDFYTKLSLIHI